MTGLALLNPAGAVALVAIAVLIVLWLWDRRRRVVPIGTLFLWERLPPHVLERQRFRPDVSFLLQLAILAALIGGLVRPAIEDAGPAASGAPLVLVLDASASMQTREEAGTRFELARRRAEREIQKLAADDELMVITAADRAHVDLQWGRDHGQARAVLETLTPADTPTALAPALELALAAAESRTGTRILVLSDLPPEASGLGPDAIARVSWVQLGRADDNVAVAGVTVDAPIFQDAAAATATVLVRNYGRASRDVVLDARVNDVPWVRRALTLAPRATEHVLLASPPSDGVLDVRLITDDAVAVDDRARAWISTGRPLSLLLVTDSRELADGFASIASAIAGSQVEVMTRARFEEHPPEGRRAALFDRFVPAALPPAVNALYVAPPPNDPVCAALGTRDGATVVDWEPDHPLLRGLDGLQALTTERVRQLGRPSWGTPIVLAAAERTAFPFLVAGERDGRRTACLGAELVGSLASSDRLPLLMLTLSTLRWLADPYDWRALAIETGRPTLLGPGPRQPIRGPTEGLGLEIVGEPPVVVADRAGVYRLGPAGGERVVLANLVDDAESDVGRDGGGEWPARVAAGMAAPAVARREIGGWFSLAALVLLPIEWFVWRRRRAAEARR